MRIRLTDIKKDETLVALGKVESALEGTIESFNTKNRYNLSDSYVDDLTSSFTLASWRVPSALERAKPSEYSATLALVENSIAPKMQGLLARVDAQSYPSAYKSATEAFERVRAAVDEFLENAPAELAPASSAPQATETQSILNLT
ncbi:MAG: hypothetical protein AAF204_03050 [Pseudomonadota bacterium]